MNAKHIVGTVALAAATLLSAQAASAADGVWRVGSSYVVRYENLDLRSADGRAAFLDMVETGAKRLCRSEQTRARRTACASEAVEQALAAADIAAQQAFQTALVERDGVVLASR